MDAFFIILPPERNCFSAGWEKSGNYKTVGGCQKGVYGVLRAKKGS
jgi:hypothetical protein